MCEGQVCLMGGPVRLCDWAALCNICLEKAGEHLRPFHPLTCYSFRVTSTFDGKLLSSSPTSTTPSLLHRQPHATYPHATLLGMIPFVYAD